MRCPARSKTVQVNSLRQILRSNEETLRQEVNIKAKTEKSTIECKNIDEITSKNEVQVTLGMEFVTTWITGVSVDT